MIQEDCLMKTIKLRFNSSLLHTSPTRKRGKFAAILACASG